MSEQDYSTALFHVVADDMVKIAMKELERGPLPKKEYLMCINEVISQFTRNLHNLLMEQMDND